MSERRWATFFGAVAIVLAFEAGYASVSPYVLEPRPVAVFICAIMAAVAGALAMRELRP